MPFIADAILHAYIYAVFRWCWWFRCRWFRYFIAMLDFSAAATCCAWCTALRWCLRRCALLPPCASLLMPLTLMFIDIDCHIFDADITLYADFFDVFSSSAIYSFLMILFHARRLFADAYFLSLSSLIFVCWRCFLSFYFSRFRRHCWYAAFDIFATLPLSFFFHACCHFRYWCRRAFFDCFHAFRHAWYYDDDDATSCCLFTLHADAFHADDAAIFFSFHAADFLADWFRYDYISDYYAFALLIFDIFAIVCCWYFHYYWCRWCWHFAFAFSLLLFINMLHIFTLSAIKFAWYIYIISLLSIFSYWYFRFLPFRFCCWWFSSRQLFISSLMLAAFRRAPCGCAYLLRSDAIDILLICCRHCWWLSMPPFHCFIDFSVFLMMPPFSSLLLTPCWCFSFFFFSPDYADAASPCRFTLLMLMIFDASRWLLFLRHAWCRFLSLLLRLPFSRLYLIFDTLSMPITLLSLSLYFLMILLSYADIPLMPLFHFAIIWFLLLYIGAMPPFSAFSAYISLLIDADDWCRHADFYAIDLFHLIFADFYFRFSFFHILNTPHAITLICRHADYYVMLRMALYDVTFSYFDYAAIISLRHYFLPFHAAFAFFFFCRFSAAWCFRCCAYYFLLLFRRCHFRFATSLLFAADIFLFAMMLPCLRQLFTFRHTFFLTLSLFMLILTAIKLPLLLPFQPPPRHNNKITLAGAIDCFRCFSFADISIIWCFLRFHWLPPLFMLFWCRWCHTRMLHFVLPWFIYYWYYAAYFHALLLYFVVFIYFILHCLLTPLPYILIFSFSSDYFSASYAFSFFIFWFSSFWCHLLPCYYALFSDIFRCWCHCFRAPLIDDFRAFDAIFLSFFAVLRFHFHWLLLFMMMFSRYHAMLMLYHFRAVLLFTPAYCLLTWFRLFLIDFAISSLSFRHYCCRFMLPLIIFCFRAMPPLIISITLISPLSMPLSFIDYWLRYFLFHHADAFIIAIWCWWLITLALTALINIFDVCHYFRLRFSLLMLIFRWLLRHYAFCFHFFRHYYYLFFIIY